MPRTKAKVPNYCLHKPSGQAVIYLNRHPVYLGPYGSERSHERYEQEVARWRVRCATGADASHDLSMQVPSCRTVAELILAYLRHAKGYYVDGHGATTKEFVEMKLAARPLRQVHGGTLLTDFGPRALKEVRAHMVDGGTLCRDVINRRINRLRRIFKWGVSEELAPPGTYEALRAVDPLKQGRTTARETEGIKPVPRIGPHPTLDRRSCQHQTALRVHGSLPIPATTPRRACSGRRHSGRRFQYCLAG